MVKHDADSHTDTTLRVFNEDEFASFGFGSAVEDWCGDWFGVFFFYFFFFNGGGAFAVAS